MVIGVISDTHDQIGTIKRVVQMLNQEGVSLVVHCGDWVSPFVLGHLKELKAPIRGVFGNNDGDRFRHLLIAQKSNMNLQMEERFMAFEHEGRHIAVFHGDYSELVDGLVKSGDYDAVFHGHTHKAVNQQVGKTLSLNPGCFLEETLPHICGASFALYDPRTNQAEIRPI
jgi:putative phosphoesterase